MSKWGPTKAVRTSRSFIAVPNNLCPEDILRLQNRRARVESFFRGFEISVQKRVACGNFRTLMRCLRFSGEKLSRTKLFTASSQAKKIFQYAEKTFKNFPESEQREKFLQESDSKMRIEPGKENRFENKKWRIPAGFTKANRPAESIRGVFFDSQGKLQKVF
jgi:hypothetical protein